MTECCLTDSRIRRNEACPCQWVCLLAQRFMQKLQCELFKNKHTLCALLVNFYPLILRWNCGSVKGLLKEHRTVHYFDCRFTSILGSRLKIEEGVASVVPAVGQSAMHRVIWGLRTETKDDVLYTLTEDIINSPRHMQQMNFIKDCLSIFFTKSELLCWQIEYDIRGYF